jgi:hypothetical protein
MHGYFSSSKHARKKQNMLPDTFAIDNVILGFFLSGYAGSSNAKVSAKGDVTRDASGKGTRNQ